MASMFTKISRRASSVSAACGNISQRQRTAISSALFMALVLVPEIALAGGGGQGSNFFCYIATYFKGIVGSAALVAILAWAIEHILGVAKLHDIVVKVGVGCAIVIGSATIIANSGLSSGCVV